MKSKAEVDKYAERILSRCKSESEVNRLWSGTLSWPDSFWSNLRFCTCFWKANTQSLKIAQLYFHINEYECCKKFLSSYLSEHTQDAAAWKLLGELAELIDHSYSKAIEYYAQ